MIDGQAIWVTVSIGVSYAPAGRPHSVMAMISAADRGLYQAKNGGRDRVVFGVECACGWEIPRRQWSRKIVRPRASETL